jgi:hypothetical protein
MENWMSKQPDPQPEVWECVEGFACELEIDGRLEQLLYRVGDRAYANDPAVLAHSQFFRPFGSPDINRARGLFR